MTQWSSKQCYRATVNVFLKKSAPVGKFSQTFNLRSSLQRVIKVTFWKDSWRIFQRSLFSYGFIQHSTRHKRGRKSKRGTLLDHLMMHMCVRRLKLGCAKTRLHATFHSCPGYRWRKKQERKLDCSAWCSCTSILHGARETQGVQKRLPCMEQLMDGGLAHGGLSMT